MNVARFGLKVKNIYGAWIYGRLERDFKGRLNFNFSVSQDSCDSSDAEPDMETLCQCTGVRDSDGNLIYENDCLSIGKYGKDKVNYVVYSENNCSFDIQYESGVVHSIATLRYLMEKDKDFIVKVVGNKFDREKEK